MDVEFKFLFERLGRCHNVAGGCSSVQFKFLFERLGLHCHPRSGLRKFEFKFLFERLGLLREHAHIHAENVQIPL